MENNNDDMPEMPRQPFPARPVGFTEPDPDTWLWLSQYIREIFDDGGRPLEMDFALAQLAWYAERKLGSK